MMLYITDILKEIIIFTAIVSLMVTEGVIFYTTGLFVICILQEIFLIVGINVVLFVLFIYFVLSDIIPKIVHRIIPKFIINIILSPFQLILEGLLFITKEIIIYTIDYYVFAYYEPFIFWISESFILVYKAIYRIKPTNDRLQQEILTKESQFVLVLYCTYHLFWVILLAHCVTLSIDKTYGHKFLLPYPNPEIAQYMYLYSEGYISFTFIYLFFIVCPIISLAIQLFIKIPGNDVIAHCSFQFYRITFYCARNYYNRDFGLTIEDLKKRFNSEKYLSKGLYEYYFIYTNSYMFFLALHANGILAYSKILSPIGIYLISDT